MTLKHDKKSYFLLVVRMLKKNQFVFIFNLFFRLHFFCFRLFRRDRPTIFQVCRPAFLHASTSLLAACSIACFTAKSQLSSKKFSCTPTNRKRRKQKLYNGAQNTGVELPNILKFKGALFLCHTSCCTFISGPHQTEKNIQVCFKDEEIPAILSNSKSDQRNIQLNMSRNLWPYVLKTFE